MAAKVKAECSTDTNSGETKDYKCSGCFKRGKRREATHYCPSCDVCYCKSCMCEHDVIGRKNIQQWGSSSKKKKVEDTCAWHPQEVLVMFCESHDELCCRLCLSNKHRFCKDTMELQSIKDKTVTENDTELVLQMLDRLKKQATGLNEDRNLRCQTVETSYKACQTRLGEFRKRVNSKFDEIGLELSKHKLNYLERYKGDQIVCANALNALEGFQQRFGESKQQYNAYDLKKCKDWVSCTQNNLEINRLVIQDSFVPIAQLDIESTVGTIDKLGTINTTHVSFSTKIDGDVENCKIVGMCQMPDGSIIIADSANKKLKKFDRAFITTGHCEIEFYPQDVCCVNDTEVAVTRGDRKITFVSIGDTLDITRSITTSFDAYNVDSSSHYLYLPIDTHSNISLNTYNMSDNTFRSSETPVRTSSWQRRLPVAYCKDRLRLLVAINGGLLLSSDGIGFMKTETKQYKEPVGLCVDDADCVYVSDSSSNEVKKLDSATKENLIWSTSIPTTPDCLCFDSHHGRVLVACKEGDTVFVI